MQTQLRPVPTRVEIDEGAPRRLPRRKRRRWQIPPSVGEFLLFYLAAVLRFLACGFRYFPQLDDYIQYDKYARFAPLGEMVERLGLLASRPLAGVLDIAFWSRFWNGGMMAALLLLGAMWTASALLFRRVFNRLFGCGALFCVLYLLLPLNVEGTYWISAATRIVCGMFFCALSLWLYLRCVEGGGWYCAIGFAAAQMAAFCFYEQVLALAGGAALGMMLIFLRTRKTRCSALCGGITLVNFAGYFLFTGLHGTGSLAERMQLVLPWHEGYFSYFLPELLGQMKSAFFGGGLYTLSRGFVRGLAMIADGGLWWYLVLFVFLALAVGGFCLTPAGSNGRATRRVGPGWMGFALAGLCVLAAISPFFVVGNPWFSLRNTVPALAGLALLGELGLRAIFGRQARFFRQTAAAVACVLTLVFGIASVSEVHDYRATYENDQAVLAVLADELDGAEGRIGVLNLNPSALDEQNCFWHEHIHGVTESYWAIQGALWAMCEDVPDVYPLAVDSYPYYVGWNRELKRIGGFDALYWWDAESAVLMPLTAEGSDEGGWILRDPDGVQVALVWEHEGAGYLE